MPSIRSPGGSNWPYYFQGGVLFGVHSGSFGADESAYLARLIAERDFMRANLRSIPVWFDFYEIRITSRIVSEFAKTAGELSGSISRLALVGCSRRNQRRIRRALVRSGFAAGHPLACFADPEAAKRWLVGVPPG